MCIIAVYQNGKRPTRERVSYMMRVNPDGVGIAWNDGARVAFRKGFTKADDVLRFVDRLNGARDIVFHARIATSGGVSAEKCHPYVIATSAKNLDRTAYAGRVPVVFHNGVLPVNIDAGLNDSQTFIRHCVAPLYNLDAPALLRGDFDDILKLSTRGSRILILTPDAVKMYGEWTTDKDDGVTYSNTHYKPAPAYYSRWAEEYDGYDFGGWTRNKNGGWVQTINGGQTAKGGAKSEK